MSELIQASLFGFNIIPTMLLGLATLYWIIVMIGALDIDIFHLHIEADVDADSLFESVLLFFNIGKVPLTLLFSFTFLFMWSTAVFTKIIFDYNVLLSGLLIIPELIAGALITNVILFPFRNIFKSIKEMDSGITVLQKKCRLTTDLAPGRIGQAEILTEGASVLVNVKSMKNIPFKKGSSALIIQKDKNRNIYDIIPYEEILPLLKQEVKDA